MVKSFFRLLLGIFRAELSFLLSLQLAPGTMNTVVIIGVAGFFVTLAILIMAVAIVLSSHNHAEAQVRISMLAMESQVRTAAISRAQLDRFFEAGGLVLEKEGSNYLAEPGCRKPVRWKKAGLQRRKWTT